MINRLILFLTILLLLTIFSIIHSPYDFIYPKVTTSLAEQNEKVEDGSITSVQKQNIWDECGLDKDCIDKKCIELYPDKRVHSIHCYAEVREYQKEREPNKKLYTTIERKGDYNGIMCDTLEDFNKYFDALIDADYEYLNSFRKKPNSPCFKAPDGMVVEIIGESPESPSIVEISPPGMDDSVWTHINTLKEKY